MENQPQIVQPALKQQSTDLEVVFAEIGDRRLSFVVPLSEELDLISKSFADAKLVENQLHRMRGEVFEGFGRLFDRELSRRDVSASWSHLNKLADLAELAGRFNEYEALLTESHRLANSPFTALRMAASAQHSKKFDSALVYLKQAESVDPIIPKIHRAYIDASRGRLDDALDLVNTCKRIDPLSYEVNLFLGALQLYKGHFRSAITAFRDALEERPNSSVAHTNIAIAWASEGKLEKAYKAASTAVALNPIGKNAAILLADLARELKRDRSVLKHLEQVTSAQPSDPTLWSRLARARYACGMFDEARSALLRQAAFDQSPIVWNNLGVVEACRKSPGQAQKYYREALHAVGGDLSIEAISEAKYSATRNLIALLYDGQEWKRIRQIYSDLGGIGAPAITKTSESLSDIHGYSLEALRKLGKLSEMVDEALELLEHEKLNVGLAAWLLANLLSICSMYRQHGHLLHQVIERSKMFLDTARNLPVRGKQTLSNNLAFALATIGQLAEAEQRLGHIQTTLYRDAYPTATLGLISLRKGNAVRGSELYRRAISLAPTNWDKARLRQKLQLELARLELAIDLPRARRRLTKMAVNKLDEALADDYRSLISLLTVPNFPPQWK
jgi:tetratricopeptide (TPR) repeat protein